MGRTKDKTLGGRTQETRAPAARSHKRKVGDDQNNRRGGFGNREKPEDFGLRGTSQPSKGLYGTTKERKKHRPGGPQAKHRCRYEKRQTPQWVGKYAGKQNGGGKKKEGDFPIPTEKKNRLGKGKEAETKGSTPNNSRHALKYQMNRL